MSSFVGLECISMSLLQRYVDAPVTDICCRPDGAVGNILDSQSKVPGSIRAGIVGMFIGLW